MKFFHNSLNFLYFLSYANWVKYWYVLIPWEFCVFVWHRNVVWLFWFQYVNTLWIWRAGGNKPVYIPPGLTPSQRTLHPTDLASKLPFQCRCARVSQKLNSLILFPVKNTISCYVMTWVWTSFMTMWEVREWYPNVPVLWFLVNDQRDAQISFYAFIFIYNALHVSNTSCSSSGEKNCINTIFLSWWWARGVRNM